MKTIVENGLTVIHPEEGMVLTNGDVYSETKIYLGSVDRAENWRDVPIEEYEKIKAAEAAEGGEVL